MTTTVYSFGPFRLVPYDRLTMGTTPLHLQPKTLKLLTLLVTRHPEKVTNEEIYQHVWGNDTVVEDGSIYVHVSNIRSLLKQHSDLNYIDNVRDSDPKERGYRFVAPVEKSSGEPEGARAARRPAQPPDGRHRLAWVDFAHTITDSHLSREPEEYPYAQRPQAITLRATFGDPPEHHEDAVKLIRRHLQPGTLNFLVGEYGAGKSYVSGALAYQLADEFLSDPDGPTLLPVILPLRQTTSLSNLDALLRSTLFTLYGVAFSPASFLAAHQSRRLVLILDGLDEMIARTDRKDIRYHLSYLTQSTFLKTTPMVITTRPNVIPSASYYQGLNRGFGNFNRFTLDPLDELEVQKYFEALRLQDVWKVLTSGPASLLKDLVTRPLYVEMITLTEEKIRAAPATSLTVQQLYDFYFTHWYERELRNQGCSPGEMDKEDVRRLLAHVARLMACAGKPYVSESVFRRSVEEGLVPATRADAHNFFMAARERLILVPDFTDDEVRFTFRHDSLKAYFYALYLAANDLKDEYLSGLDAAATDFLFALAENDERLASRLSALTAEGVDYGAPTKKSVLAFLWQRKLGRPPDPALVGWLCGGDEEVRAAIGRSLAGITFEPGVTFADVNFGGANLSGGSLRRAIFERGTLADANLTGVDLSGSTFQATRIDGSKFVGAELSGTRFRRVRHGRGAEFVRATAADVKITESDFVQTKFTLAHLTGLDARDTNFTGVSFAGSELRNAKFFGCRFEDCDFSKAVLTGATFDDDCGFSGTDLSGAIR